jgi:hypothetical protein
MGRAQGGGGAGLTIREFARDDRAENADDAAKNSVPSLGASAKGLRYLWS